MRFERDTPLNHLLTPSDSSPLSPLGLWSPRTPQDTPPPLPLHRQHFFDPLPGCPIPNLSNLSNPTNDTGPLPKGNLSADAQQFPQPVTSLARASTRHFHHGQPHVVLPLTDRVHCRLAAPAAKACPLIQSDYRVRTQDRTNLAPPGRVSEHIDKLQPFPPGRPRRVPVDVNPERADRLAPAFPRCLAPAGRALPCSAPLLIWGTCMSVSS